MRMSRSWGLLFIALLVLCMGLAARIDCWFMCWPGNRAQTLNPLDVMIGDGQKLFSTYFYRKADVYFHSGFYPTIYDSREAFQTEHVAADAGATASKNKGDEDNFLGKPLDFIDAFSRHFFPSVHTHLTEGGAVEVGGHPMELAEGTNGEVGEILPWLRFSALLDPDKPETYVVTAYWLRQRMGRVKEAEAFLHEGLRYNPNSYQILFALGQAYYESDHDVARARNIWLAALRKWKEQESSKKEPDLRSLAKIADNLALLEEKEGNYERAIGFFEEAKKGSPHPADLEAQIVELKAKLASRPATK